MVGCTFLSSLKSANGLILVGCMRLDNNALNISLLLQPLGSQPPKLGDGHRLFHFLCMFPGCQVHFASEPHSSTCPGMCMGLGMGTVQMLLWYQVLCCPSASGEGLDIDLSRNARAKGVSSD